MRFKTILDFRAIITQNGEFRAVLLDVQSYQEMKKTFTLLKVIPLIHNLAGYLSSWRGAAGNFFMRWGNSEKCGRLDVEIGMKYWMELPQGRFRITCKPYKKRKRYMERFPQKIENPF